ncbi:hypothetical protein SLS63_008473 [Diaporthe eres]|uniref:Uncharacterized protein n=1 Tax=Diaporthe eres TaxID=83184 RepID=A0ABR1P2P0_DIAER
MVIGQSALLDKGMIKELGLQSGQPARDVFLRYGKHYVRQEPRECLLNHARTAETMPGLPSWCPNFASRPETAPLTSRRLGPISVYDDHRPAGDTAPAFHAGFSVEGGGRWAIPRSRLFHGKLLANILRGRDGLPWDLRPRRSEAYVHGIMYGEALRLFSEGRVEETSWVVE